MILKYKLIILIFFINYFSTFAQVNAPDFKQLYTELENTSFENSNFQALLIQALESANSKKNVNEIAQMYDWAIHVFSDPKTILYYSNLYEVLGKKSQNTQWIIRALQGKAYAYSLERNYNESLIYELEALHLIEKLNQPYLYFSSLYSIGTTKLFMGQYNEALEVFKKTTVYFENFRDYNDVMGYFNSKRLEALCYFYLKDYKLAQQQIKKGFDEMHRLKPTDKPLEISYYKLTQAMLLYKLNQFEESILLLNQALPLIIENEDFANENLAYLYLGKNEWKNNRKETAITYFKKIDELFNDKNFTSLELKKAYNYLILDAKQKEQIKDQLYYTNQLLAVTTQLQNKHFNLSDAFYNENEIEKTNLLRNKEELKQDIEKTNKRNALLFIVGILIISALVYVVYRNHFKNKKLKIQFEKLKTKYHLNQINISTEEIEINDFDVFYLSNQSNQSTKNRIATVEEELEKNAINELPENLVKNFDSKLKEFEKNKRFLEQDITLAKLAEDWSTNRSYLSKYFNHYKEDNFNSYINNLRIDYAIVKLHSDLKFRKYSIDALAIEFGFSKRRHFSDVFIKKTGITPSYYINQLEKSKQKSI